VATPIPFIVFCAVVMSPFLSRTLLYRSVNDTDYSPRYSEQGFEALPIGASRAEIYRVLGPPFRSSVSGDELWLYYSDHHYMGHSRNFWMKFLILDNKTMTLKRKIDEFAVP
jgi:hypothetical protein